MIEGKKNWVLPAIILLSLAVFGLDVYTPLGSADYMFYFFPVVLCVLQERTMLPIWVALTSTILSVFGYQLSPSSNAIVEIALKNRFYAGSAIWISAFLVMRIISTRNEQDRINWVRFKIGELVARLRGELPPQELAERMLSFLAETTGALVGTVYIKDEKTPTFSFLTGHAVEDIEEKRNKKISRGQGLLGQILVEGKMINLSPVPENYLNISSSIGSGKLHEIAVIPLLADNEVMGAMELAWSGPKPSVVQDLLSQISETTGISLRSAVHKEKLATLLAEAQAMTEELQAQQEELRVVNEELEQQSRALKESHSRLENQQAELEQTNQQLEEQAQALEHQSTALNEANRELSNRQQELETQAESLEKASKYKSEFLANMSHELRTPLNSSLILAKLLSDNKPGNLTEEQIKFANVIYSSGNDLLNLINDILDLSKVEAGKLSVNPENFSLTSLQSSLDSIFSPMAQQKKLKFQIELGKDLPDSIYSDRMRLDQILKNLLSNAIKFTAKGEVTLSVIRNGHDVEFKVRDTGTGIAKEQQGIIFEAFRQADGTTNRKFGGTGLGLSISRELAKLLGGHITVQSEENKGSTFTLHLPLKFSVKPKELAADVRPEAPVVSKAPEVTFTFKDDRETMKERKTKDRKILIIEDDENFAKILFDIAHEMNFKALVSPTADEGLKLAKEYIPDAIVLDIRLPDHSGLVVLDQVKANPKTRHIPVHVISSTDFSQAAREMGAVGYAMKPVTHENLKVVFQNITSLVSQTKKHVLVVEDDEVQRNHIVDLITDNDVEVDSVITVREALEKLKANTYDCMIMDISLPDLTGYELLEKVTAESSPYSFPPVIVYTARDLTREEEEKLRQYSASIIIKGAKSPERLLNEVTLFLHRIESDLPPERQKMLRDLRSREKTLDGRNILVVDDDVRNIFALTSSLESCGAHIIVARNGKESLDQLTTHPEVDLVLMDIMMPEMDGYEAMTRIRQMDKYKTLPIIALTAKTMKDDQVRCLSMGANDYLPKPLDVDKLLSLVRVWLPTKRNFFS
ncbi:MAG: response regulator [Bdellovibrionota bacterium]